MLNATPFSRMMRAKSFQETNSMTLKLYSFGPGANSLKPLATLYENGLEI